MQGRFDSSLLHHFRFVNSTLYNILVSEGKIKRNTGYVEDGIDMDHNIFFSKDPEEKISFELSPPREKVTYARGSSTAWKANQMLKVKFKKPWFGLCKPKRYELKKRTVKKLQSHPLKELPDFFPGKEFLKERKVPGSKPLGEEVLERVGMDKK